MEWLMIQIPLQGSWIMITPKFLSNNIIIKYQDLMEFPSTTNKMAYDHTTHILIYEGDKDARQHWFICEIIWDATNITNQAKQVAQFIGDLRKRVLTWYINFTKNHNWSKDEMKKSFLTFFKSQEIKHLATQKIKEIK